MRVRFALIYLGFLFTPVLLQAQKTLTVEDIWGPSSVYRVNSVDQVASMKDGEHFTQLEGFGKAARISKYSFKTYQKVADIATAKEMIPEGKKSAISIQSYEFNSDESKLLIATNMMPIYRYSFTADHYLFDLETRKLTPLSSAEGKQRQATFSPDGKHVAFVRENNVFITNIETGEETQITSDGENNRMIYGYADWVYEEEFALKTGLEWSENGTRLAFYSMDESEVPEYQMPIYGDLYPYQYTFKYPKAGEKNSVVQIHVYDLQKKKTTTLDTGNETDQYIPRIKWTRNEHQLVVLRMNRLQNKLEYLLYDFDPSKLPNNQRPQPKPIYTETSDTYIEIDDNLIFLQDGSGFIRTSEKDGFNHIYKIDFQGSATPITEGPWDVVEFKGIDEKKKLIYYTSAEEGAMYKALYVVGLDGKKKKKLSTEKGHNDAFFSNGMKYYLNFYSNANRPEKVTLHDASGKQLKTLEDNQQALDKMKDLGFVNKEFITVKGAEHDLNAWIMKPSDFDPTKKYPVYFHVYCGPGHNTVLDEWGSYDYYWHQLLTQKGIVVMSVDPRGTMFRGAAFKKSTYMELGKLELEDLLAVATHMKKEAWVDPERIGIMGWSYGGYMSSLCMTKGAGVFSMGIAVAPVTNWRFYDSIYTERFMRTPQENPSGYDDNSPLNYADKLEDPYLLVHGSADDNVHFQNAMQMADALVRNNKDFQMFMYPNKNHGIYGGWTRNHLYNLMLDFIGKNL